MDENALRRLTPEQLAELEKEGFDRGDPSGAWVIGFTFAIVATVVVVVLAVDYLYQETLQKFTYESVLAPESVELREVRTREAEQLNHYRYANAEKTQVRLPIDRAMELFAAEAKDGKLFYPAKPAPVKTAEQLAATGPDGKPVAPAAGAGATPPAGAGVDTKK